MSTYVALYYGIFKSNPVSKSNGDHYDFPDKLKLLYKSFL